MRLSSEIFSRLTLLRSVIVFPWQWHKRPRTREEGDFPSKETGFQRTSYLSMPSNLMMRSVSKRSATPYRCGGSPSNCKMFKFHSSMYGGLPNVAPCGANRRGKVTSHATFEYPTRLQLSEGYDWMVTVSKQKRVSETQQNRML